MYQADMKAHGGQQVYVCANLHAAVVNDHRMKLNVWVEFRHFLTLSQKQPIRQFPATGDMQSIQLLGERDDGELT